MNEYKDDGNTGKGGGEFGADAETVEK